jgi:hypothetical protein
LLPLLSKIQVSPLAPRAVAELGEEEAVEEGDDAVHKEEHLGFGRIVVSEIEAPIFSVNLG